MVEAKLGYSAYLRSPESSSFAGWVGRGERHLSWPKTSVFCHNTAGSKNRNSIHPVNSIIKYYPCSMPTQRQTATPRRAEGGKAHRCVCLMLLLNHQDEKQDQKIHCLSRVWLLSCEQSASSYHREERREAAFRSQDGGRVGRASGGKTPGSR